jgi:hypothetical protein
LEHGLDPEPTKWRTYLTGREGQFISLPWWHDDIDRITFPLLYPRGQESYHKGIPLQNAAEEPESQLGIQIIMLQHMYINVFKAPRDSREASQNLNLQLDDNLDAEDEGAENLDDDPENDPNDDPLGQLNIISSVSSLQNDGNKFESKIKIKINIIDRRPLSIQGSQDLISLRVFDTQSIPDADFSDAESNDGLDLEGDLESIVAGSIDNPRKYRAKTKGPAKFASRRDYLLYVMRLISRGTGWQQHHWLWWGQLAQKWVITQFNKMMNERVSYEKMVQDTCSYRAILPADLIDAYQRWLNNMIHNQSKLSNFYKS